MKLDEVLAALMAVREEAGGDAECFLQISLLDEGGYGADPPVLAGVKAGHQRVFLGSPAVVAEKDHPLIATDIRIHDRILFIDLWYPRVDEEVHTIELGLTDVRSADSIRISYDFERDGYQVQQASTFEWPAGTTEFDRDWQEVAFIPAWGRQKIQEEED